MAMRRHYEDTVLEARVTTLEMALEDAEAKAESWRDLARSRKDQKQVDWIIALEAELSVARKAVLVEGDRATGLEKKAALADEAFPVLVDAWTEATGYLSSPSQIARHPLARLLVRLHGEDLARLALVHDRVTFPMWGLLREVLNDGPEIPKEDRGRVPKVTLHWRTWLESRYTALKEPS